MPGDPLSASPGPAGPESQPSTSLGPQLGFDRQGVLEISAGAVVALIALSSSNGASASSLPRWRSWLSMLNWRRDPDHERKLALIETSIAFYEQRIQDSERRTKQIESEIEQIEKESELIENESEQLRRESEQIRNEAEQIRQETERLRRQNAKGKQLLSQIDALCFQDIFSSIPPPPTAIDSEPSSH